VKHWELCGDILMLAEGYGSEHFAPGNQESIFSGVLDYTVIHNVLLTLAHGAKCYNNEFKKKQKGK